MPEWLQLITNLVSIIGIATMLYWAFRLGGELSRMKERQDSQEERMDRIQDEVNRCPPREECTELFRELSVDISSLNAKMDIALEYIKRDRNRS